MDLCHLKNVELAKHFRKNNGRVVLQVDSVKVEGAHRAVFTEQDASASQMTAAQFLDTISKLPGMAGETSDTVSAYTQVQMTEAPRSIRLSKEECPEMWIRIPARHRPTSCEKIDWSPICQLSLGLTNRRRAIGKKTMEKVPAWQCLYVHKGSDYSYLCTRTIF